MRVEPSSVGLVSLQEETLESLLPLYLLTCEDTAKTWSSVNQAEDSQQNPTMLVP